MFADFSSSYMNVFQLRYVVVVITHTPRPLLGQVHWFSVSETTGLRGLSPTTFSEGRNKRKHPVGRLCERKSCVGVTGQSRMGRLVPGDRKETVTQITTGY